MPDEIGERKRALRRRFREARLGLDDVATRSRQLWSHVRAEPAVLAAGTIMVFESNPGEPDAADFVAWCRERGAHVVVPAATRGAGPPADPTSIDVVIVPGLAFTPAGDRLGQGGGWYDRVLARVRTDCTTIGVGFDVQIVDELPIGEHDRRLDLVITESGPFVRRPT